MSLNLIKLCVGVDSAEHLLALQSARLERQRAAGQALKLVHRTRQIPRRRSELLDGGSLYWVIRGVIGVRQRFLDICEQKDVEGRKCCDLILSPTHIETYPQPRRAFQGWRYLTGEDAPADRVSDGADIGELPAAMRAELIELGLL